MSEAATWLESAITDAPEHLRSRMRDAVLVARGDTVYETLAEAAFMRLRASMNDPDGPHCALDLLTADALLTHACALAADAGPAVLEEFTGKLDAARFNQLLDHAP